ncbi:GYDIA family GHMP kinase [Gaetbulibacter sp. M240]|uniref:GYDIA family GHMP kinase n=1 Tax=Gaetbulibacter sp. M240 TaxID=3126511 RepID=UPI00374E2D83
MKVFSSHGKLLLTGEYVVLDGALALALPTKYGQTLHAELSSNSKIVWKSYDNEGNIWYEDTFELKQLEKSIISDNPNSKRLIEIINAARELNPNFLKDFQGFKVSTYLEFPRNWGLGSSSTLINNIAQWAEVDAYILLDKTFGGSGYDIACAQHKTPILYELDGPTRKVQPVNFNPDFKPQLYFVHLNKKQNSRDGIKHYQTHKKNLAHLITKINAITKDLLACTTLSDFGKGIRAHETLISEITQQTPVKDLYFQDFNGAIKSLGAWGGDFILVTSETDPSAYFKERGYDTILNYTEMIL